MATDQMIDPVTRDFVDGPNGDWLEDETSATSVFVQLDAEEGRWWGDPDAGSQNKAILRSDVPTTAAIVDSTTRALRALAQAGAIASVVVQEDFADEAPERGFGQLIVSWFDRATNRPADLAYAALGSTVQANPQT